MTSTRYLSTRYRVDKAEGPLHKAFPELFKHKPFQKLIKREDCDRLVRYIVYVYDHNSELVNEFQNDLQARKEEAAKDAGYRKVNDKWGDAIQEIMDIRDHGATDAIMEYLRIQKKNVWTEICICEQELFDYQTIRFTPVTKKKKVDALDEKLIIESTVKKDALMKSCDQRILKLKSLYQEFFGDNKDVQEAEFTESVTPETAERLISEAPYEEVKDQDSIPA